MRIRINSDNKYLLDLLNKNPNTDEGLYAFELKDGVVVGFVNKWFSDDEYKDYAIDYFTESNDYAIDKTNRLDLGSLHRPKIAIHILDKMFGDIFNDKWLTEIKPWLDKSNEDLDNIKVNGYIYDIWINSSWVKNNEFILSKYFPQISIDKFNGDLYNLKFTNCKNLRECLYLMMVVSMLIEITNKYEGDRLEDSFVDKYLNILTKLENVPYFVFYLFSLRVAKNEYQYNSILNTAVTYLNKQGFNIDINLRYTHTNRKNAICNYIDVDKPILDYGCGEFQYLKKFTKHGFKSRYYAYDLDKDLYKIGVAIENRSDFEKLILLNDDELPKEKVNVIVTEVIEHLEYEDSIKMMQNLIDNVDFDKFIFTTPNKSFNVHYFLSDDEMRHSDHKFELDRKGLEEYLSKLKNITYTIEYNGDIINEQPVTWLVKIQKNNG